MDGIQEMETNEDFPFNIYIEPKLQSSVMVIGWIEDSDHLGEEVTDYLIKKLGCTEFGEVKSSEFFPSKAISEEGVTTGFIESKFYYCQKKNIVVFRSSPPRFEWYKFIDALLDMAELCQAKELYTINGEAASCIHSAPRKLLVTINLPELKNTLSRHNIAIDIVDKKSPDQKPTLNSFLLWLAKRRNIAGANIHVTVPHYLASIDDPQSCKISAEFLNERFNLGIDFEDLDEETNSLNETINNLRVQFPEIDSCIRKLEHELSPTPEEKGKLVEEIRNAYKMPD